MNHQPFFEHAFAAFDQVEQQPSAAVQVKALPAACGSAKAAKVATPKRKSGKAITARIRDPRCQPGKRQARLKASAMGNAPFARAANLLEMDEAERRQKIAEAITFLRLALVGGRRPAHAVIHEAAQAGIAERTLYHAKEVLGIESVRKGYTGGHWVWKAPRLGEGAKS